MYGFFHKEKNDFMKKVPTHAYVRTRPPGEPINIIAA